MKNSIIFTTIITLALYSITANADTVTGLTSYASGTVLNAGDLNNDNTQIKSAVDDNNSKIGANTTAIGVNATNIATKQTRVSETCAVGQSIRVINADGTVTCEVDTNTTYSAGSGLSLSGTSFSVNPSLTVNSITYNSPRTHYISIPAQAFVSSLGNPVNTSWGNGGAYPTTVANDAMVAPVYLPDGAVITEYYFYYVDNDAATDMSASLQRRTHLGALTTINTLTSSGTPSASAVSKSATLAVTVNNSLNNYSVRVSAFPWPGSEILRIYSVRISYTITTVE